MKLIAQIINDDGSPRAQKFFKGSTSIRKGDVLLVTPAVSGEVLEATHTLVQIEFKLHVKIKLHVPVTDEELDKYKWSLYSDTLRYEREATRFIGKEGLPS